MSETVEPVTCPICGNTAEIGAVYTREGAIQWVGGKPDWKKRLDVTFLGSYTILGKVGLFLASYAPGILCRSCRRVVLEYPEHKDYFPDVKK